MARRRILPNGRVNVDHVLRKLIDAPSTFDRRRAKLADAGVNEDPPVGQLANRSVKARSPDSKFGSLAVDVGSAANDVHSRAADVDPLPAGQPLQGRGAPAHAPDGEPAVVPSFPVPPLVRPLEPRDVDALYRMIVLLAEFEKIAHLVMTSPAKLAADAFGPEPQFFASVAETDGQLVGYAVYSFAYYTFTGRWLYLDDLYVHESARGSGIGKALLAALADDALVRGCFGIQWFVLDWNEQAIRFYDAMGATIDRAWLAEKVRGPEAIRAFQARLRAVGG